jgi:hypothetical protein
VSTYAKTNKHEYYAEGYERYQWGTLPSEHVLYQHFKNIPKVEKWLASGDVKITKVYHRHAPADWNDDQGTYHAHGDAEKGHTHGWKGSLT